MRRNLKIGERFALGFGVIVLMVTALAVTSVFSLHILKRVTDVATKQALPQARRVAAMQLSIGVAEQSVAIESEGNSQFCQSYGRGKV